MHPDAQHRAQLTSSGNSGTDVVRFHPAGHAFLQVVDQNRGHLRVFYVRCLQVPVSDMGRDRKPRLLPACGAVLPEGTAEPSGFY